MTTTEPSAEALAIDLLCEMRPSVRREVFEDFMAGRSPQTPYLHIDPCEFLVIAAATYRRGVEEGRRLAFPKRERVPFAPPQDGI